MKRTSVLLALAALFIALLSCSNSYTVSFYIVNSNPNSDDYGDYVLAGMRRVEKGGYIERIDASFFGPGVTGWYWGPLLHNLDKVLTAENIESVKREKSAQEFIPVYYYGARRANANPTRVSRDISLYACYGEQVDIYYHYYEYDSIYGVTHLVRSDPIPNAKNAVIDEANIPKELLGGVEGTGNAYCYSGFAYLVEGMDPADRVDKANIEDSEYGQSYEKISLGSEIAAQDTHVYLLYSIAINVKIMQWERYVDNGAVKYKYGQYGDTITIGKGNYLPSSLEPEFAGCIGWYWTVSSDTVNQVYRAASSSSMAPPEGFEKFSFGVSILDDEAGKTVNQAYIFPVFIQSVTLKFRYYDGHMLGSSYMPSFSFKQVLNSEGSDEISITCSPDDGYLINTADFPSEGTLNKKFNIPYAEEGSENENYRSDIWDSANASVAYEYPGKKIEWGQVLSSNPLLQPNKVSDCTVDDSASFNMIEKIEIGSDARLRVVPVSSSSSEPPVAYLYAISSRMSGL